MVKKTLNYDKVKINKRKFHASKNPVILNWVNADEIVMSLRFKHGDESLKYFIGYRNGDIIRPLCIMLPQMSGYIHFLITVAKICHSWLKVITLFAKCNEFWDKIKELIETKLITSLFMIINT